MKQGLYLCSYRVWQCIVWSLSVYLYVVQSTWNVSGLGSPNSALCSHNYPAFVRVSSVGLVVLLVCVWGKSENGLSIQPNPTSTRYEMNPSHLLVSNFIYFITFTFIHFMMTKISRRVPIGNKTTEIKWKCRSTRVRARNLTVIKKRLTSGN